MTEWQPIDTAPKDQDKVLLLGWALLAVDMGHWDADQYAKKPRPFWNWHDLRGREYMRRGPPTHWMPLPKPPERPANAPVQPPGDSGAQVIDKSGAKSSENLDGIRERPEG